MQGMAPRVGGIGRIAAGAYNQRMVDPAPKPATYQDVLDAPPHMVAELVDGELHLQPRPASKHARASSNLGADINHPFDRGRGGPGGWWILDEPELHLGPDVLVPDLAGWRRDRMPEFPDVPFFTLPPDWVCEVLSPSTSRIDKVLKARIYAREQVPWFWLVDPKARLVEVRRLQEGQWVIVDTADASAPVRLPPFDAVELNPADWFVGDEDG
jgi:Uma2 family endonuclease